VRDASWAAYKRSWDIPTHRKVVVYLGLLAEYQGVSHLLAAAKNICRQRDDAHFLLAGYPNVEFYRKEAAELGIAERVTFTGKVPYEHAARVLALGDVAAAPKLSATEGAGKLLNYMAMALPTVAFDTPVSREYLGEQGVYAARGDADDLARCLLALLNDPQRCADLGAALRQRAMAHYAWDGAIQQITGLYAQALR
jgi:glycosyltransferase involved in cell wall biosynthesis